VRERHRYYAIVAKLRLKAKKCAGKNVKVAKAIDND
jgi:hypothetical protein